MASKEKKVIAESPRRVLGKRGEQLAADFFIARGDEIIARNWRMSAGEIDCVVKRGNEYHIVEVKTRKSLMAGYPEESITEAKLERLDLLAQAFFEERGLESPDYHIDVFAIIIKPDGSHEIRLIEDIG